MSSKFYFDSVKPNDYAELASWFKKHNWPAVPAPGSIPNTGFIVRDDEQGLAACWLYLTNSNIALLEWIVRNPKAPMKRAVVALGKLIRHVKMNFVAKCEPKIGQVWAFTSNERLANTLSKRHGFRLTNSNDFLLTWDVPHDTLKKEGVS